MVLTATAERMRDSLPLYYHENSIIERVLQARANEIDRLDALIDQLKLGLIPGMAADDSLRLLSLWEAILALPVAPAGVPVSQRQTVIRGTLKRLSVVTAADVLELLASSGAPAFAIERDTPGLLQDTLTIHYPEGSYLAAIVLRTARRAWPAHRELLVGYDEGFVLGTSVLGTDAL